jgi:hypothetical protein
MKIVNLEKAILEAKKLAKKKLAIGDNADEFVEIGDADGFRLYATTGKTSRMSPQFLFMKIQETFSCWCLREK